MNARMAVGPMISTHLTEDMLVRLDGVAARSGSSRAETLRDAIGAYLDTNRVAVLETHASELLERVPARSGQLGEYRNLYVVIDVLSATVSVRSLQGDGREWNELVIRLPLSTHESRPSPSSVNAILRTLQPWASRLISDTKVEWNSYDLGDDAIACLDEVENIIEPWADDRASDADNIEDWTEEIVDAVADCLAATTTDDEIRRLVSQETIEMKGVVPEHVDTAYVDERVATDALMALRDSMSDGE